MTRFASASLDLSQLPAPLVVEALDFETILALLIDDLTTRFTAAGLDLDTAHLETEPAAIIAQSFSYALLLMRGRVNDAAKAVMLAFAVGADLDQLGANKDVQRLIDDIEGTIEPDDDYRLRIQLSPEGYTTAGSEGSYVFWGLTADPDVKDIQAVSPTPGDVVVYVLSRTGSGAAGSDLLDAVEAAVSADEVRPLTDNVTVASADITNYAIEAELVMYPGPDSEVVRLAALAAVTAYAAASHRLGYDIALSGLYAALHQPGVQRVNLAHPTANLVAGDGDAYFANSIVVTTAALTDV